MSTGPREFDTGDNGQSAGSAYPGPMPHGGGGDSLFQIAWRGKWFIVLAVLLGLGGAYAYLRRLPPEYSSTSRILVSVPDARSKSEIPIPVVSKPNLTTQASMIASSVIVSAALSDPNVLAVTGGTEESPQDLTRKLSARVGKDDIISVSASAQRPEAAAAFVNAVVSAYINWHGVNRQFSTAEFLRELNAQLDRLSQDLTRRRRDMKAFEDRNPGIADSARGGLVSQMLDHLREELVTARLQAIAMNDFCGRLKSLEQDPNKLRQYVYGQQLVMEIAVDDAEWTRVTEELYKIRLQREQLSAGGTVPKSQIALLQNRENWLVQRSAELEKEFVKKYLTLANARLEDAVNREKQLTSMYAQESAKLQKSGQESSEYALLIKECDILERQCSSLSEQISKVPADSGQAGVSVYVLEKAMPAAQPSSPMTRILGIGLVLGLMVGGGLALVRDWRDQRVRSAEEIVTLLGVPILGAVPTLRRHAILRRGPQLQLAWHSEDFEAYRAIRTALFFGTGRGDGKTFLVTSPGALEGKTTLVGHLGVAMAQAGQKTLIVDADLRKPAEYRIFANGSQGKGLVEVLAGTVTLEEAVRPTKIPGLDVLEGGQFVPSPSELLGSEALGTVFESLQGRYDRILVDSPPVGACADAQILATRCDLTLLVLRAEKSSRGATQRAREALSTVSARVAGVVVNDVGKRDRRYSHQGYGAYNYYGGSNGGQKSRQEWPEELEAQASHEVPQADGGAQVQNGPLTPEKTINSSSNSQLAHVIRKAVSHELPVKGIPSPKKQRDGRKARPNSLSAVGDSNSQTEVFAPEKKRNGRRAAANDLPTQVGAAPESEAAADKKEGNGRKAAAEDLSADANAEPKAADLASGNDNRGAVEEKPPTDADLPQDKEDPTEESKKWLNGGK